MPAKTWTDSRIEVLHSMWRSGCTAKAIGHKLGCSRNAVIGKLHRDGIKKDGGVPGEPRAKTLLLLDAGECHYPVNAAKNNEPHLFCAKVKSLGSAYCLEHHGIVYISR